jgi:hypothetical protein
MIALATLSSRFVANPTNPSIVGSIAANGVATHVGVRGQCAYIADDTSGLFIAQLLSQ